MQGRVFADQNNSNPVLAAGRDPSGLAVSVICCRVPGFGGHCGGPLVELGSIKKIAYHFYLLLGGELSEYGARPGIFFLVGAVS